jgi:hypothetical protein
MEARALVGDLRQRVQEVARRARETVKARHKQGVAIVKAAYRAPAQRARSSRRWQSP